MCVNTKNYHWERPALEADYEILGNYFPGIDFKGLLTAMSKDKARPLTSDLVLVGALIHSSTNEFGIRSVPFSCIEELTQNIVKLPVMDQIVEWFENSALGTDMWQNASDWMESHYGARV